jgi:hypothetical protein
MIATGTRVRLTADVDFAEEGVTQKAGTVGVIDHYDHAEILGTGSVGEQIAMVVIDGSLWPVSPSKLEPA